MTSIRAVFTPTPEMVAYNEATKARREEMSAKTLHQTEAKESLAKDTVEIAKPKKKSFWKGFASYWITGLGQMIDGRTKTGFKQLGTEVALGGVSGLATALSLKAMQTGNKYGFIAGIGLGVLAGIGIIANKIHSVVDAYKGGK